MNGLWRQWQATCRRQPGRVAVIEPVSGRAWTRAELHDLVFSFEEKLRVFRPGEKVAFQLPNSAEWFALFLALQRAGLVAVPLDASLPPGGRKDLFHHAGVHAFYREGHFEPVEGKARRAPSVCCLKITSGSEGRPKIVACQPRHLLADGRNVTATMGIGPRDVNLGVIPLGHSYGLGNLVLPLVQQGTAVVAASAYVPRQIAEWIGEYRVTVLPLVPALLRVLAGLPAGLRPARTVISAGAMLSPEIARAFHELHRLRIHNFYGSSETGGICYDRTGQAALTGRSVGKPLRGVRVRIERGRVTVSGPAVATRTGRRRLNDAAEWNGQRELVLLGRLGGEANIGGKKVHPREVERELRSLPGVTDAAVWREHREGRDFLGAAVETARSRAALEHDLGSRLPAWKMPRHLHVARELPRNARGKLDLVRIRA